MSVLVYKHYTHKCIKIQLEGGGGVRHAKNRQEWNAYILR